MTGQIKRCALGARRFFLRPGCKPALCAENFREIVQSPGRIVFIFYVNFLLILEASSYILYFVVKISIL